MINIFTTNNDSHVLGFTFHIFDRDRYVVDYQKHNSQFEMNIYFRDSKSDVLGINLEYFLIHCEKNISSSTILIDNSLNDLKKLVTWRVKNKEKYDKFLNFVVEGNTRMKSLLDSLDGEEKVKAFFMYKMIQNFATAELNGNKKFQNTNNKTP